MVKVSIIIPINDNSSLSGSSLECILNQSLEDIEIVFAVQESDAQSLTALSSLKEKDKRVRIVEVDDSRKSVALNTGLTAARGEYVYFFSLGDSIAENALEEIYENASNVDSDIVLFKVFDDKADERYMDLGKEAPDIFDFNHIRKYIFRAPFIQGYKLFRTSFLKSNEFSFDEEIGLHDIIFHIHTIIRAQRISYCDKVELNHNFTEAHMVEDSRSNEMDIFYVINTVVSIFKKEKKFIPFEIELNDFLMRGVEWFIIQADSRLYYKKARRQFALIHYGLIRILPEDMLELYDLVTDNKSYEQFKIEYGECKSR